MQDETLRRTLRAEASRFLKIAISASSSAIVRAAVALIYDRFFSLLDLGIWSVFQFVDVFISE